MPPKKEDAKISKLRLRDRKVNLSSLQSLHVRSVGGLSGLSSTRLRLMVDVKSDVGSDGDRFPLEWKVTTPPPSTNDSSSRYYRLSAEPDGNCLVHSFMKSMYPPYKDSYIHEHKTVLEGKVINTYTSLEEAVADNMFTLIDDNDNYLLEPSHVAAWKRLLVEWRLGTVVAQRKSSAEYIHSTEKTRKYLSKTNTLVRVVEKLENNVLLSKDQVIILTFVSWSPGLHVFERLVRQLPPVEGKLIWEVRGSKVKRYKKFVNDWLSNIQNVWLHNLRSVIEPDMKLSTSHNTEFTELNQFIIRDNHNERSWLDLIASDYDSVQTIVQMLVPFEYPVMKGKKVIGTETLYRVATGLESQAIDIIDARRAEMNTEWTTYIDNDEEFTAQFGTSTKLDVISKYLNYMNSESRKLIRQTVVGNDMKIVGNPSGFGSVSSTGATGLGRGAPHFPFPVGLGSEMTTLYRNLAEHKVFGYYSREFLTHKGNLDASLAFYLFAAGNMTNLVGEKVNLFMVSKGEMEKSPIKGANRSSFLYLPGYHTDINIKRKSVVIVNVNRAHYDNIVIIKDVGSVEETTTFLLPPGDDFVNLLISELEIFK
jgi:hypothetical protein